MVADRSDHVCHVMRELIVRVSYKSDASQHVILVQQPKLINIKFI
jgi:hypothetical protein